MSTLETALCERLGIEYPIVQAPIGSGTSPALAAAVSNAGGLGMHSVTWRSTDDTEATVRETREATDRPFGVNLVVDPKTYQELTAPNLEACLAAGVEVISISFGDAAPYVDRVHDAGGVVMQSVGSVAEARSAVEAGVDIVVTQGWEAGGHVQGETATLPLVPRVVDAVGDTPVVAAGGIADGRGIAAVLALGATGAWLGTRFLATREAAVHERYKERVVEATEAETVYTELFDVGWSEPRTGCSETTRSSGGRLPGDRPRANVRARTKPSPNPPTDSR